MYAPASFKAARRETPAGRLFSGVDFSGEIPYHRSILSSAVRCGKWSEPVSYTHLRAHETRSNLVCRLLLEKIFFNDTATTEIYTRKIVGSVRCV